MGNTFPPLATSTLRLVLFAVPAWLVSRQPAFRLSHLWYLAVGSVFVAFGATMWLLHREFARKLGGALEPARPAATA